MAARTLVKVVAGLLALATVCVVVQLVWVASGDRSEVVGERLAEGVVYDRIIWSEPRPVVIHVATVDLNVEGVEIEIGADYRDDGQVLARSTSAYVRDSGVTLGVNGGFFYPFEEYPPWSAYPNTGEPVTVLGHVAIDGVVYGSAWEPATFSLIEDGPGRPPRIEVGELADGADQAISGATVLVADGVVGDVEHVGERPGAGAAYARTVIAADETRGVVFLVVVDGKQPGYSGGLTLSETARFLVEELGATHAVELDGGGSSTMVAADDGGTRRLSRPINARIPGRERVVANHIGVRTG